ncbi:hypothetical protein G5714_023793 [Onychostoma macrolepis]|uniref:Ubiquitin-like domain-containing protein n=1 Tax=Onychostoma macrolepis TaxID=369639 RepID=A0A7J6BKH7_9TELE|nr:hypothetical protein G5714_023793 [Onychostoma macrolepis]
MTLKEFIRRFCPEEEDLDRYRYTFAGRQLEGDRTLGYYGINYCSTIQMTVRVRGGGPLPPEDEGEGMSRTESMEILADMQQTEPEPNR